MKTIVYSGMMNGLTIDRSRRDSTYNMVKHWHSECEIQYFIEGNRYFLIGEKTYQVQPGTLVMIHPDCVHNTFSGKYIYHDRVLVLYEASKFPRITQSMGEDLETFFLKHHGIMQVPPADRAYVQTLLANIADEVIQKEYNYQVMVETKLIELFIFIQRIKNFRGFSDEPSETLGEQSELVNQITAFIRRNYASIHSLEQIASSFYLDKSYLCRIFKRTTGYTITEYTNIQRIRQSQRLLEDTDWDIAEIARKSGYSNIAYYNRVFKKYTETSPLQYRKKQIAYKESLREKNNF
ncbi:AraC family transcriptional regulator [Enterococcus sp.]|jgi:AraC-like DNA-binding protein|uniref:AraC family transcriptional regulator n=1 Tax=Enterococcus sp. TaxID=35783 RepID=UPI0025BF6F1F|nr:AraC family transcriptional regulator [Enterococcus sp.]